MRFVFQIVHPDGTLTIDEPIGWDAITFHLQRDPKWHGFFDFIDDSVSGLQFIGEGRNLLQDLYSTLGAEANAQLKVFIACEPNEDATLLYIGSFDFTSYKFVQSNTCYVEIGVETNTELMKFRNRYDQQVNLDSLVSFDAPDEEQTISGEAFFESGPRRITLDSVERGLKQGMKIIISGTTSNNGEFTITDIGYTLPDNLPPAFSDSAAFSAPNTIAFANPHLEFIVGCTFSVTGSASNDGTYTCTSVIYTPTGTNIQVAETVVNEGLGGITVEILSYQSQTILTVLQSVTDEVGPYTITALYPSANLPDYTYLDNDILLKSKEIQYTSRWESNEDRIFDTKMYSFTIPCTDVGGVGRTTFTPDWPATQTELEVTGIGIAQMQDGYPSNDPPDTMIQVESGLLKCSGPATFSFRAKGSQTPHNGCDGSAYNMTSLQLVVTAWTVWDPALFATQVGDAGPYQWRFPFDQNNEFDVTGEFIIDGFGDNYYLWIYYQIGADNFDNCCWPDLLLRKGSFFQLKYDSLCEDTNASSYLINETLSRCAEAYTNDNMRVYSDYFGRTDAQPYPSEETGCGGLECVTNGLKVRNALVPNAQNRVLMTTSMQDAFESMDAIHNIGMGMENDPNRSGFNLLRIEPVRYFYQGQVVMTCNAVMTIERESDPSKIISQLRVGYQKWETWNNNGLYDMYTERTYRTTLSQIQNTIDRLSKYLASDYAIEFTRRLYGKSTSDYRYDNDVFVICLVDGYRGPARFLGNDLQVFSELPASSFKQGDTITISGSDNNDGTYTIDGVEFNGTLTIITVTGPAFTSEIAASIILRDLTNPFYQVEQGIINDPVNILHPETVYNYRITPARNAMRQFKNAVMAYRQYTTGKIKFTEGAGNFYAMGQIEGECAVENQLLGESVDISRPYFEDQYEANPLFLPEIIRFEYPVTYDQFLDIIAQPYGLIGFQGGDGLIDYGWIQDFKYKPREGMGNFELRPIYFPAFMIAGDGSDVIGGNDTLLEKTETLVG